MTSGADEVASLVLAHFDKLPPKRKPAVRDNGVHDWVPLSGIVARGPDARPRCIALATGMKCLPASRVPLANGVGVHDWHAEILALRAFNHFILEECRGVALRGRASPFLRLRTADEMAAAAAAASAEDADAAWRGQPFSWKDGVTLHMYCSEAPCGDASMELTMAAQDDASPWEVPPPPPPLTSTSTSTPTAAGDVPAPLPGRAYFSNLGIVRRKPSRPDAPPTLSKSCSDKLALKQCTSLLSSPTALLVHPASVYLSTLVLPESQFSPAGCSRAFSSHGRMRSLAAVAGLADGSGYGFKPFRVETTRHEFAFSKRSVAERAAGRTAASNLAVAWSRAGLEESLIGGVVQGRKQFDPRGAALVSRRKMWALALEVAGLVGASCGGVQKLLKSSTYREVKEGKELAARRQVKDDARSEALAGWVKNTGDDDFRLDN